MACFYSAMLAWNPTAVDTRTCVLDGDAFLDGVHAGAVRWTGLELAESSNLYATDMVIDRSLEALTLSAAKGASISLEGTKTASLIDRVGDDEDGWGAGNASLDLNSFRYERLISPSGKARNLPIDIRYWRKRWLARRTDQSSTQAARQLSRVLHEQGLHEGSRSILMDAFAEEGRHAPTRGLVWLHGIFGILFGHGFSGSKAFLTIMGFWFLGIAGAAYLQSDGLLVEADNPIKPCFSVDPSLYAVDVLLPVIDLDQESQCQLSKASSKSEAQKLPTTHWFGNDYVLFSAPAIAGYALAIYRLIGWIIFSIALATWSGLFKRSGRSV